MKRTLALAALCLSLGSAALAQTVTPAPSLLHYQGRISLPNGTPVADPSPTLPYTLRLSLWDAATGGTKKWEQVITVQTKNGVFSALLNLGTGGANGITADQILNGNVWMETKVGNDAVLAPRQQIVSVAYALKANTVPDSAITAAKLADLAVLATKIANDAITTAKLANNAVTAEKLAELAVTAAKLADNAVTTAKIADNAITNAKIANNAVNSAKLFSDAASLSRVSGGTMTASGTKINIAQPLTANGLIESLAGGFKFPDGTFQTTAISGSNSLPTGSVISYFGLAAPNGWVRMSGKTIGNSASGATERANDDTFTLFSMLWSSTDNSVLPIQDNTGATIAKGASAISDFAANRRLILPDARGRVLVGLDNFGGVPANRLTAASVGGVNAGALGGFGGEETHILTVDELASHSHGVGYNPVGGGGGTNLDGSGPHIVPSQSTGGSQPHSITQPWLALGYIIKL